MLRRHRNFHTLESLTRILPTCCLMLAAGFTFGQAEGAAMRTFKAAPSYFVGNVAHAKTGQKLVANDDVLAFVQTQRGRVLFTPSGAFIGMGVTAEFDPSSDTKKMLIEEETIRPTKTVVLKTGFSAEHGRKRAIMPRLAEPTHHIVSFMKGSRENWQTGLTTYRKLVYDHVWDGITLEYLAYQDRLEYQLILETGSNPSNIVMETGATHLEVAVDGALLAHLDGGILRLSPPIAFQEINGQRREVSVSFQPTSDGRYRFILGDYDETNELIIDPELTWSTFLGGPGGNGNEDAHAIAVDTTGQPHITGAIPTADFPTVAGSHDESWNGNYDAFVTKLNNTGTGLEYSTFLGGSGSDNAYGIALDATGNAYVIGLTGSSDFPATSGAFDEDLTSFWDAFVVKLNATGTALVYATFLGGNADDRGRGIAVDGSGNAYVTGWTQSSTFPVTSGVFDETWDGSHDVFVAKFTSDGSALTYATFLGGAQLDQAHGIAVDSSGNATITGQTQSATFPTTSGAYQETHTGSYDVFVAQLNPTATALNFSTFLGGTQNDYGSGIAQDASGDFYLTGYTYSTDFPTTVGAYQETIGGSDDIFAAKINATGSALTYATFVGTSSSDQGAGIAVDDSGKAYVSGFTGSNTFPTTTGAYDENHNGSYDGVVFKLNADGSDLEYSTYLGGSNYDRCRCLAIDTSGNAYIGGTTSSADFPTTSGCFDDTYKGDSDAFVTKLNDTGSALSFSTFLGGTGREQSGAIAMDASGDVYVCGRTLSNGFPTTTGAFDELYNGEYDGVVTKINATGTGLSYSTFLGGTAQEYCRGIAVDDSGNAYVTGDTTSTDFPTTTGAYDETHNGSTDVYVVRLNASGTGLTYATFIGSSGGESGEDIALDGAGNAYVTGLARDGYPVTPGAFQEVSAGSGELFVTKLNPTGSGLAYSTFVGGSGSDSYPRIEVDSSGYAYVSGYTSSTDFPTTTGAFQESYAGSSFDGYVFKLNSTGSSLIYATYLGSSGTDYINNISVDSAGYAYVAGRATTADFPITTGAYDETHNGGYDAFVSKLTTDGSDLSFSTYLGGSSSDTAYGIFADGSGNAVVTGYTYSYNFPTLPGAFDTSYNGGSGDAFLAKLSHNGSVLAYGTYLGGSGTGSDRGNDVAADDLGRTCVLGTTDSIDFPTTSGAFDESLNGYADLYVAVFDLQCFPPPEATVSGDANICLGGVTTIQAELTGLPPWDITWSDGFTQNGLNTSPASRVVSPSSTTVYTVTAFNDANCSGISTGTATITVTVIPAQPGAISGHTEVCDGDSGENYSIAAVPGATDYTWTVPPDASITSGQGSIAISVDFGSTSGDISVSADNFCGSSSPQTLAVTVHPRPTATVSGDAAICAGDTTPIQADLTGTGPWDVSWSDGFDQLGVVAGPATRDVSPASTTVYEVDLVTDTYCSDDGSGTATITVIPLPTATVSGDDVICLGDTTTVQADLTGTPPWDVTWSDGTPYTNVMTSPLFHDVTPTVSTVYTVTAIDDANCSGTSSGGATVQVRTFGVETDPPKSAAQGLSVLTFTAFSYCDTPPTELEWTIPATGFSFGIDVNPIDLDPIPTETTTYQIRATDQSTRATVTREVILFVAADPIFLDYNGDGCNNVADIWALAPEWPGEMPNDPNGDGVFNMLDYMYINTDDPYPCP